MSARWPATSAAAAAAGCEEELGIIMESIPFEDGKATAET
jgi:hypothetical protein